MLGSYQAIASRGHALALSERMLPADPMVATRLAQQGAAGLGQAIRREADILAFNDVFMLIAALALLTAAYLIYIRIFNTLRERSAAPGNVA
jgi:hypothetical protein